MYLPMYRGVRSNTRNPGEQEAIDQTIQSARTGWQGGKTLQKRQEINGGNVKWMGEMQVGWRVACVAGIWDTYACAARSPCTSAGKEQ